MFYKPNFSGDEIAKHVVVISLDALSETEWERVKKLYNFGYIIRNGVCTDALESVFPTHTYTVHTTMVTGVYPDKHGILHNHQLQPFIPDTKQTWYWYQKEINVPTIYDLAKKNHMTTAGLLWPVTGKSSITYNFPEIIALEGENQTFKILRNGTISYLIDLELRLGKYRKGTEPPLLDDFTSLCAQDTLIKKKPNLTLIHFTDLDHTKHTNRIESKEIDFSLNRLDRRVGEIIKATKYAGIYDDTVFVLLGDHGQFSVDYNVHLNNLLKEVGLIYEKDGRKKWRAYLQSTGGNAYLHYQDELAGKKAIEVLRKAMEEGIYGIESIYDRNILDNFHVHKSIQYVIEGKPGYNFSDELCDITIENYKEMGKKYATHGYAPTKPGYKCIFMAFGPGIKKDYYIRNMQMVDVAPTIARIMGMKFYPCDGITRKELFI